MNSFIDRTLKSEITVFLSLVLVIMISMIFTVIDAARNNSTSFQTEVVTDAALQSALAEYNIELLSQYDLFFTDLGYGSSESGYILLEQHINNYMTDNFDIKGISLTGFIRDLLNISVDHVAVTKASGAADGVGRVLERQAVDYMLDKVGLYDVSKLSSEIDSAAAGDLFDNESVEEKYNNTNEKLSEYKSSWNPAHKVNRIRGSSRVLSTVTGGAEISSASAVLSEYISHRNYLERDGFLLGERIPDAAEDLLFQLYIGEKTGTYTSPKEDSFLKYQLEYILSGYSSDRENLDKVVNTLLKLREVSNFAYIMTDADKQAQAELMSAACIITILVPELLEVVKYGILIAWAYAESLNDLKVLLKGGKIPIIKTSDTWQLGLENALDVNLSEELPDKGLSYNEYLHLLLAVMNKNTRNMRFMDVIEMDIRKLPGYSHFALDNCINTFSVQIQTGSSWGHSNIITRTVGYQK